MSEAATISYLLPAKQNVHIEICNVLGQQVVEVINEQEAAGQHAVNFDRKGMAAGIYFVRIIADNNLVAVRKMVVVQ